MTRSGTSAPPLPAPSWSTTRWPGSTARPRAPRQPTSLKPGPLVPLVTSTCPSARMVAFICRRANCMPGDTAPCRRGLVQIDHFCGAGRRVAASGIEDLPRRVHHRGAQPAVRHDAVAHRGPLPVTCRTQVSRGPREAGQEELAVRRDEHRGIERIGDRERSAGQPAPGDAVAQLRDGDRGPGLVGAGDGQDTAVGQHGQRRVITALRHRAGRGPVPGGRVEDHRSRVAILAGDLAPRDQQPAVGKEGVPAAEDLVRLAQRGEACGGMGGIPQVRGTALAPEQHLAGRQQVAWMPTTGVGNVGPHWPRVAEELDPLGRRPLRRFCAG